MQTERLVSFVFPNLGLPELLIIAAVAMLIFGGRRLGELGRGLGEGIRNFRNAVGSGKDEKSVEGEKTPKPSA